MKEPKAEAVRQGGIGRRTNLIANARTGPVSGQLSVLQNILTGQIRKVKVIRSGSLFPGLGFQGLDINGKLLALFVQMTPLQPQRPGRVGHAALVSP